MCDNQFNMWKNIFCIFSDEKQMYHWTYIVEWFFNSFIMGF